MYKVRLIFQTLGKEFFKFGIFHTELSLDERMITTIVNILEKCFYEEAN
jgi:hypothetical protein